MAEMRNEQGTIIGFACGPADIDHLGAGVDEYELQDEEKYCQVCGYELNITQRYTGCPFKSEPDHVASEL